MNALKGHAIVGLQVKALGMHFHNSLKKKPWVSKRIHPIVQ